ncbi:uncharacterized protein LOC116240371 isoform X11 [Phasianus colchicus]|nr:uncharacterized protein LOC116240371 isoform X11 [Phasianus colchicus]
MSHPSALSPRCHIPVPPHPRLTSWCHLSAVTSPCRVPTSWCHRRPSVSPCHSANVTSPCVPVPRPHVVSHPRGTQLCAGVTSWRATSPQLCPLVSPPSPLSHPFVTSIPVSHSMPVSPCHVPSPFCPHLGMGTVGKLRHVSPCWGRGCPLSWCHSVWEGGEGQGAVGHRYWDILGHTGMGRTQGHDVPGGIKTYWDILGWDGTHEDVMYQAASRHTGTNWEVLGGTGMGWDTRGHDVPGCIKTYWDILGHTGTYWDGIHEDVMCQVASRHTGTYWDRMGHTQGHDVPGCIRTHWDVLGHTGMGHTGTEEDVMCQVASGHTGRYWEVLGGTGMGHTGTQEDVMCQVASGHTGMYWVILGRDTLGHTRT